MASAEIIGAAIGILLMMIVAYLLVGSTLTAAEIVTTAQKDVTLQNEARLRTDIKISHVSNTTSEVNFALNNTGSERINDFNHLDVFSYEISSGYQRYTYDSSGTGGLKKYTIIKFDRDFVHPKILNPGEAVWICATYSVPAPTSILVSTANGVYTSATVP
jgi:flagellar protein FlaF